MATTQPLTSVLRMAHQYKMNKATFSTIKCCASGIATSNAARELPAASSRHHIHINHAVRSTSLVSTSFPNLLRPTQSHTFSTSTENKTEETTKEKPTEESATPESNDTATSEEATASAEQEPSVEEQLRAEVASLKDKLMRSYAEQENIRRIAKNDVESARNFAVQSFAKSLLDTSDNLSRAMEAVPEEYREDKENNPVLATLYEGIKMTDDGLNKAFEKNGLKKFGSVGDKFDPNMHDALFEYPDPTKEPGTLGQVMKIGFSLKGRTIRSAEVGVIKKP